LRRKYQKSSSIGSNFILYLFNNKKIYNFVKYVAPKKGKTTNFFPPYSLLMLLLDPASRVQDKHPGSATLVAKNIQYKTSHFCTLQLTLRCCRRYRQHHRRLVSWWRAGGPQLWMRNRQSPVLQGGRGRGCPHPQPFQTRGRSRAWPHPSHTRGRSPVWPHPSQTRRRGPAWPPPAYTKEKKPAWPPLALTRGRRPAWPPLAHTRGRSRAWPPHAYTRVRRPTWPPLVHPQPRRPSPDHPFLVKIFNL
jgi:hypothetical protein